jgi:hypothetical protein
MYIYIWRCPEIGLPQIIQSWSIVLLKDPWVLLHWCRFLSTSGLWPCCENHETQGASHFWGSKSWLLGIMMSFFGISWWFPWDFHEISINANDELTWLDGDFSWHFRHEKYGSKPWRRSGWSGNEEFANLKPWPVRQFVDLPFLKMVMFNSCFCMFTKG